MVPNPDYVEPDPASDKEEATTLVNTTDPQIPCGYTGAPSVSTTVAGDVSQYRDAIAWGRNDYGQVGEAPDTLGEKNPAIYVTVAGTDRDADGQDVDLLKIYTGGSHDQ